MLLHLNSLITYGVSIIPERPPPKPPEKEGASSSISASVKKTKKHKLNLTLKGGNFDFKEHQNYYCIICVHTITQHLTASCYFS